jgi:hypothetical protein
MYWMILLVYRNFPLYSSKDSVTNESKYMYDLLALTLIMFFQAISLSKFNSRY